MFWMSHTLSQRNVYKNEQKLGKNVKKIRIWMQKSQTEKHD